MSFIASYSAPGVYTSGCPEFSLFNDLFKQQGNGNSTNPYYKRHSHFDYRCITLQNSDEFDLTSQLQSYDYLKYVALTIDGIDGINNFNEISFIIDDVSFTFTKNQLVLYDKLIKKIIFRNKCTNKSIVNIPFWFCNNKCNVALNVKADNNLLLKISHKTNDFSVDLFVAEVEDQEQQMLRVDQHIGKEYLIEYYKEFTFKMNPETFKKEAKFYTNFDFDVPIKEIWWYYTTRNSGKVKVNPVADKVLLTIGIDGHLQNREYTKDQCTGSYQTIHYNGNYVEGLYCVSFGTNPSEYQPTGELMNYYGKFTLTHKINENVVSEFDMIDVRIIVIGYNVVRYIDNKYSLAYTT